MKTKLLYYLSKQQNQLEEAELTLHPGQERENTLKDAVQFHHFILESDELSGWVEEKQNVCLEQDYLDFTNLQGTGWKLADVGAAAGTPPPPINSTRRRRR